MLILSVTFILALNKMNIDTMETNRIAVFKTARCRYCGCILSLSGSPLEILFRVWAHFLKDGRDDCIREIIRIYSRWFSLSESEKVGVINDLLRRHFIPVEQTQLSITQ